jgi:hypothetical protein
MARRSHMLAKNPLRALWTVAAFMVMSAIATTVAAHPGHGITPNGDSAAHYLLEPMHGLGAVLILVVVAATLAIVRCRTIARRSQV